VNKAHGPLVGEAGGVRWIYHRILWETNSLLLKMAIEIVGLRIKNDDFP
jgi:hypothetical protein